MRKKVALLLSLFLILALCACGTSKNNPFDKIINEPNTISRMIEAFGGQYNYKYDDVMLDSGMASLKFEDVDFYKFKGKLFLDYRDDGYFSWTWLKYVKGNMEQAPVNYVSWECRNAEGTRSEIEKYFVDKFDKQYGSHTADGDRYKWTDDNGNRFYLEVWDDEEGYGILIEAYPPNYK